MADGRSTHTIMADVLSPPHELVEQVRNALAHLYDYAYLQTHPLAARLDATQALDDVSRAQMLRRTLLDALDCLRPRDPADDIAAGSRAYTVLTYRYVDGLAVEEIMAKLALSRRQVYREHAKGIRAIASLIAARHRHPVILANEEPLRGATPQDRLALAHAEVDRLRQNARPERVAVYPILQAVCSLLAPRFQQAEVTVSLNARASIADSMYSIVADRTLLRQALFNLLSYAVDAVADSGDLCIDITNRGERVGIHVYEVPATREAIRTEGTREGVGLAVAQAIIESLGGQLQLDSHASQWQAHVLLPIARMPTLLVVDDNAGLITLIQRYLGGHQVAVVGARQGSQVQDLARKIHPQLIILDLMMPGRDGWEVLNALKNDKELASIPVVICSVLKEVDLAHAMGACDYLIKPVSQSQLLGVLRRWLGTLYPVV